MFKYILLAVGLILIVGSFYWYEIRPIEIRKKCASVAEKYSQKFQKDTAEIRKPEGLTREDILPIIKLKKLKYETCQNEHGL